MTVGLMRATVIGRDGGCVARRIDPDAGPCRDKWGHTVDYLPTDALEADYVRLRSKAGRHVLPGDHVALCPGHHRGTGSQQGYVWATSHRAEERAYLDSLVHEHRPTPASIETGEWRCACGATR